MLACGVLSGVAHAQPMGMGMPDPSAMSGIPRPDGSVPPGKLSVRLIRNDFAHPIVGEKVKLDGPGGPRTATSDDAGRAWFEGLPTGGGEPFTASATIGGTTMSTQPITLPPMAGVKVMLVFKGDAPAAGTTSPSSTAKTPAETKAPANAPTKAPALAAAPADPNEGVARPDPALPPDAIEVVALGPDGKPAAGINVVLAHGSREQADKVDEIPAKADAQGRAHFQGKVSSDDGYLVALRGEGVSAQSKPFRLEGKSGVRVELRASAAGHDASVLSFGRQSHLILEVKDEQLEVIENLVLENRSSAPYDPGPDGLRLTLPDDARGAQQAGEPSQHFTVEGRQVIWKGEIPPGPSQIAFGFVLPTSGPAVELRQKLSVPMDALVAISDRFDGMDVEGDGIEKHEREMGGRRFYLVSGPKVPAGGEIQLRVVGLPQRSPLLRFLGAGLAAVVALWGLAAAMRARRNGPDRAALEAERAALLDEIAALEVAAQTSGASAQGHGKDGKRGRRREELVSRLEAIYRALDESAA
jgi:hypothetical protein